jgi:Ca2+/Na+ antiporter
MKVFVPKMALWMAKRLSVKPEKTADFQRYYFNNGFYGGMYLGILVFIFNLIHSFKLALVGGLGLWLFILLLYLFVIYPIYEIYKPRQLSKRMNSRKYSFLHQNNFEIVDGLCLRGVYKSYLFSVFPCEKVERKKRNIRYDVIVCHYSFGEKGQEKAWYTQKENEMCGSYVFGNLIFASGSVSYIPYGYENVDFQGNFEALVSVLKRENLDPTDLESGSELKPA